MRLEAKMNETFNERYIQAKNVTETARWNWALTLKENLSLLSMILKQRNLLDLSGARCNRTRKQYPMYLQMGLCT